MAFIVGCDIKGYSTLGLQEQYVLTAHLAGCHIKSLAIARLTPLAFNDAGDGFFVVFDTSTGNSWREYMKNLSRFYYTEQDERISILARSHWLKIAAGEGSVYVTPQNGIRGDGINNVAGVLDVCKLPVPLEIVSDSVRGRNLLHVIDKHGIKLYVAPVLVDWPPNVCILSQPCESNPFYLLKHPALPAMYQDIDRDHWWDAFNAYILLTPEVRENYKNALFDEGDWREYLSPAYVTGHTNVNIFERVDAIARQLSSPHGETFSKIRIIYLHPNSDHARRLKGEDGTTTLREKILTSLEKLQTRFAQTNLAELVQIGFSASPVSTGVHKVLDCMILIHYGDDFRSWNAHYRFLSYFGSERERDEFRKYIDFYFHRLWARRAQGASQPSEVNYIVEEIAGNQVEEFIRKVNS